MPVPVAELHSRKAVQPNCPAFPDKVQRGGTVVDIGQYSCMLAVCDHPVKQLPEAERAVAQAVVAMEIQDHLLFLYRLTPLLIARVPNLVRILSLALERLSSSMVSLKRSVW